MFNFLRSLGFGKKKVINPVPLIDIEIPMMGNSVIDHDHLEIVRLISQASDLVDKAEFFNFSMKCLDYINNHFKAEEKFMESINFPGLRLHKLAHQSLYNFIKVYLRPKADRTFTNEETVNVCKKALRKHIENHDIPLSKYLNGAA